MRKLVIILTTVCLALLALPAAAEEMGAGAIGRVSVWGVRQGMGKQFEQGLKKHNDFHKRHNDNWVFGTWQILSGENTGRYYRGTFDHQWSDFDAEEKLGPEDDADAAVNLDPYMEPGATSYYAKLKDMSRPWEGTGPSPMSTLIWFEVKIDQEDEFMLLMHRVHEAILKTSWPVHYTWYRLVNGGEEPAFVLALPRKNFADMAPPSMSFDAMLEQALGREEARSVSSRLNSTLRGTHSELIRYRPDLSYEPAGK
jgi:hypothetical protein